MANTTHNHYFCAWLEKISLKEAHRSAQAAGGGKMEKLRSNFLTKSSPELALPQQRFV